MGALVGSGGSGESGQRGGHPAFLERLAGLLQDKDYRVRGSAAAAGGMGRAAATHTRWACALRRMLDPDTWVRESAAATVAQIERSSRIHVNRWGRWAFRPFREGPG